MIARVSGDSMRPTFVDGEEVRVDEGAYRSTSPRPGDVVLVRHPYRRATFLLKRVDHLTDGGRLYLVGDNPDATASTDSRAFGPLAPDAVVGQVLCRIASPRGRVTCARTTSGAATISSCCRRSVTCSGQTGARA